MKVELTESTFIIDYKTAKFHFKNDIRVYFKLIESAAKNEGIDLSVIDEGIEKGLLKIEGIEASDGKPVQPKQFFFLPPEIVASIRKDFLTKLMEFNKEITPEDSEKNEESSN